MLKTNINELCSTTSWTDHILRFLVDCLK